MIESMCQPGMYVTWPTHEGDAVGTGGECSQNVVTLDHRGSTYLYVPFVKNGINMTNTQGRDVISYNFTGCLMVAYTIDGQRRVGHVSTGNGQDCKAAWDAIKARASNVVEFKPSDAITVPQGWGGAWGCYGLITADGKCYSITVAKPGGQAAWVVSHQQRMGV